MRGFERKRAMGLKKWFGAAEQEEAYQEYTLSTLKVGFLVDYDLKTWQVTGYGTYDYDGFVTEEWNLTADSEVNFLERAVDDGKTFWTLTQAIEVAQIEGDIANAIIANHEPPEEVRYGDQTYTGTESGAGLFLEGGEGAGREFVTWSLEGADGRVLFISQWGERDFSACEGCRVEEYQFTDILPAAEGR